MVRRYKLTEEGRASRAARSTETRQALLDAARRLFSESGYQGVSVTEIGNEAGVSPSLINTYFDGKAGLLYALFEASNEPLEGQSLAISTADAPPVERMYAVLLAWAAVDLKDPKVYHNIMGYLWGWSDKDEARNLAERERFYAILMQIIADGQAAGQFTTHVTARVLAETLVAMYFWAMRDAVFQNRTPAEAITYFWPHMCAILGLENILPPETTLHLRTSDDGGQRPTNSNE